MRELDPGERILWCDTPDPRYSNPENVVLVNGFGLLAALTLAMLLLQLARMPRATPTLLLCGIVLAVAMQRMLLAGRQVPKRVYALTDRRLLVIDSSGGQRVVQSFAAALSELRTETAEGIGTLTIGPGLASGATSLMELRGVRNVKAVERLIRETLLAPPVRNYATQAQEESAPLRQSQSGWWTGGRGG